MFEIRVARIIIAVGNKMATVTIVLIIIIIIIIIIIKHVFTNFLILGWVLFKGFYFGDFT